VRRWVIFSDVTSSREIFNRVLDFINLSIANTSLNQDLELFVIFDIFESIGKLSDSLDCWRVLHFSVDLSQVEEGFSVCPVAELKNLFEAFYCLFILNNKLFTIIGSF